MITGTVKSYIDKSRVPVKPFLLTNDGAGEVRLTVRRTWYNSQNYPLVDSSLQEEVFKTMNAARAFAREHFGAEAGQFARS